MNTQPAASGAERGRLEHLAAALPGSQWAVLPCDTEADLAAAAAGACRAPVLAVTGSNPVPALQHLHAAGLRTRVHLAAGDPLVVASDWRLPVGLLVLPARSPALRALLAAWARHVIAGGHVLFCGGATSQPVALGLRPDYWTAHARPDGGVFLLTRRPFG